MNYDFNREWLKKKFEEIQRRLLKAIEQLDDEQLNWRRDDTNHSISTLIEHIEGNIKERISKWILQLEIVRDRENELRQEFRSKSHLRKLVTEGFQLILKTLNQISNEQLEKTQSVRNRERTNLDMLHQCAAHYSEHMGQVF